MGAMRFVSAEVCMTGRRRPDTPRGELPDDIRAGDFWKVGENSESPTGVEWMVVSPVEKGYGIGRLVHHTVREHEDGTISVRPGDGSSNSILIIGAGPTSWHGYIDHGVWEAA
jgi:hypothetical protein